MSTFLFSRLPPPLTVLLNMSPICRNLQYAGKYEELWNTKAPRRGLNVLSHVAILIPVT